MVIATFANLFAWLILQYQCHQFLAFPFLQYYMFGFYYDAIFCKDAFYSQFHYFWQSLDFLEMFVLTIVYTIVSNIKTFALYLFTPIYVTTTILILWLFFLIPFTTDWCWRSNFTITTIFVSTSVQSIVNINTMNTFYVICQ